MARTDCFPHPPGFRRAEQTDWNSGDLLLKIRLHELPGDSIRCQRGETFEFVRGTQTNDPHKLTCTTLAGG